MRWPASGAAMATSHRLSLQGAGAQAPLGVVPGVEGASAVLRMYGFTVGFDQRVAYERVRACPESGS